MRLDGGRAGDEIAAATLADAARTCDGAARFDGVTAMDRERRRRRRATIDTTRRRAAMTAGAALPSWRRDRAISFSATEDGSCECRLRRRRVGAVPDAEGLLGAGRLAPNLRGSRGRRAREPRSESGGEDVGSSSRRSPAVRSSRVPICSRPPAGRGSCDRGEQTEPEGETGGAERRSPAGGVRGRPRSRRTRGRGILRRVLTGAVRADKGRQLKRSCARAGAIELPHSDVRGALSFELALLRIPRARRSVSRVRAARGSRMRCSTS